MFGSQRRSRLQQLQQHVSPRLGIKARASRNEQLAAAFCHLSILLNLVVYVGGIFFCGAIYWYAHNRALYLAEQASKALVFQLIIWGLIAPGWVLYRLLPDWLGGFFFWPGWVLIWFFGVLIALWKAARCL